MSVVNIIFLVLIVILCVLSIIIDIGLFISWSKAKEKVFVSNWISPLTSAILCLSIILTGENDPNSIALTILLILVLPCHLTCLTPEGIRNTIFRNGGLDPVQNLSYEYKKNSIGLEQLYIYREQSSRGTYNIGIKKQKTVKMLADWYGKHGYENPLTK